MFISNIHPLLNLCKALYKFLSQAHNKDPMSLMLPNFEALLGPLINANQ